MQIVLVTLADGRCAAGQEKVRQSALKNGGVTSAISWKWDEFKKVYDNPVFKDKRGLGYWSWKPIIILDALRNLSEGDAVLYHDSGRPCYNWHIDHNLQSFSHHVLQHHNGLGIVFGPWNHGNMTKRDCLAKMNCDTHSYRAHKQLSATWSLWHKNSFCLSVLEEWKQWVLDPSRIVTDDPSQLEEYENYKSHRHDQSILTNIVLRHVFNNCYKPLFHRGYEKNINNILKLYNSSPDCTHALVPGSSDVYIFYDVFINETGSVVGIGPFYNSKVDYSKVSIQLSHGGRIKPTVVQDPHKHTNIMIFNVHCGGSEKITIWYGDTESTVATLQKITYTPKNLVASTLLKNCSKFLEPWILYHRHIGVEHFYLFDNNSSNEEHNATKAICNRYKDITTLIKWPYPYKSAVSRHSPSAQTTQQNATLYRYPSHKWVMLTDLDEFVFSQTSSLQSVLSSYENKRSSLSALVMPCMWFGCANGAQYTNDYLHKLVYRKARANRCNPGCGPKSIVNPSNCNVYSVHRPICGKKEVQLDASVLRFNHYFSLTNNPERYNLIATGARKSGNVCNCSEMDAVLDTGVSDIYKTISKGRFVFVSIPKNASQSIFSAFGIRLKDHSAPDDVGIFDNHCRCSVLRHRYPDFDTRYKFAFVRNPWDRLVSWFEYHKKFVPLYTKYTFDSWVRNGFPHHWGLQNGTRYKRERRSPLDQYEFVCDDTGKLLVDFVGKYETIESDLDRICNTLDVTLQEFPHKNKSSNASRKWKSYYTQETFDIVKQRFAKDIALFGYNDETLTS